MEQVVGAVVAYAAIFSIGSALLAAYRRRNPFVWLMFGAILGPVAVLLLLAAPPGRCAMCGASVRGWLDLCVACGHPVRGAPTSKRDMAAPQPVTAAPQTARPLTEWLFGMPAAEGQPTGAGEPTAMPGKAATPEVATLAQRGRIGGDEATQRAPLAALDAPAVRVLASGVFIGGSAGLEIGRRYEIGRSDGLLTVLGPVDSEPGKVQVEHALETITTTMINGRLVVSENGTSRRSFSLVFERIAGMSGEDLEASLQLVETVHGLA
jgi:hypothetical protein